MTFSERASAIAAGPGMSGLMPFMPFALLLLAPAGPVSHLLILALMLGLGMLHCRNRKTAFADIFKLNDSRISWWTVVFGTFALFVLVVFVQVCFDLLLSGFGIQMKDQPVMDYVLKSHGWRLFSLIFMIGLTTPVLEELAFRHFLFGGLAGRMDWRLAAILTSLIFSTAHFAWFQMPGLLVLGLAWQLVYLHTGNIANTIMLHMGNNLISIAVMFALRSAAAA